MTEEATHLRKSKPVILGAGIIWAVIGYAAPDYGVSHEQLKRAISHDQCRGDIVCDCRKKERINARDPEQSTIAKALAD